MNMKLRMYLKKKSAMKELQEDMARVKKQIFRQDTEGHFFDALDMLLARPRNKTILEKLDALESRLDSLDKYLGIHLEHRQERKEYVAAKKGEEVEGGVQYPVGSVVSQGDKVISCTLNCPRRPQGFMAEAVEKNRDKIEKIIKEACERGIRKITLYQPGGETKVRIEKTKPQTKRGR